MPFCDRSKYGFCRLASSPLCSHGPCIKKKMFFFSVSLTKVVKSGTGWSQIQFGKKIPNTFLHSFNFWNQIQSFNKKKIPREVDSIPKIVFQNVKGGEGMLRSNMFEGFSYVSAPKLFSLTPTSERHHNRTMPAKTGRYNMQWKPYNTLWTPVLWAPTIYIVLSVLIVGQISVALLAESVSITEQQSSGHQTRTPGNFTNHTNQNLKLRKVCLSEPMWVYICSWKLPETAQVVTPSMTPQTRTPRIAKQ